jgi:hypothetical protein
LLIYCCLKKGIADEIVGLKTSCGSIETLENIVKLKVNGQQRFNEDLAQISVKHNSSIGGFSEKDMVDEVADVVASKISSSTLMHKPFLPERWLKANTTCNTKKSAKQTTLISKSDLKRNSHFKYFLDVNAWSLFCSIVKIIYDFDNFVKLF